MQHFFAYVRVSTAKQGEQGVSLEQQREAINRYAEKNRLHISEWFEERETAAKRGRPVFSRMLKLLRSGKASGVIIHKIDRSARNLKDWADLGELIDQGIVVHFANEYLDLNSRGGRLSADIQAVVAADYIRNLREETRKGFYGRLKQGLYPMPAVVGYLNQGKGKPKAVDPEKAPLIRKAFELYATGNHNLDSLTAEMNRLGLRSRAGTKLQRTNLSRILNNPFYTGVIRVDGQIYQGIHEPIVSASLFREVQDVLHGKIRRKAKKNSFLLRQLFICQLCRHSMVAERQKGHVYYRCHTRGCPTRTIRENALETSIIRKLLRLEFSQEEKDYFRGRLERMRKDWGQERETTTKTLELRLGQLKDRQNRLTDAYLDGALDKEAFEQRKTALIHERRETEGQLNHFRENPTSAVDKLSSILELAGSAYLCYKLAVPEEKRQLIKTVSSNRTVEGKQPMFMLAQPFQLVADRFNVSFGAPRRTTALVWDELLARLFKAVALPGSWDTLRVPSPC